MESIAQMSPHSASFHLRGAGRVALSGKIRFLSDHLADGPKGGPLPPIRKREPHHCNIMTDAEFSCPVLVISMADAVERRAAFSARSEEHTSELQSLMRNSYAVFCLKKKKKTHI